MAKDVRTLTKSAELAELWSAVLEMIDPPRDLNTSWLENKGWLVAPATSNGHLFTSEAVALHRAIQCVRGNRYYAVVTLVEDMAYEVTVCVETLLALSEELLGGFFVLFPESRTFAVLFLDGYKLYAGPQIFVETAVGCSVVEARRRFEDENDTLEGAPPHPDEAYLRALRRYAPFSGEPPTRSGR